jgi:tRNA(His) 5'-end guanylyltransferase
MITEFDRKMKSLEKFSSQSVPSGTSFVVRLDGRSFSKMTEKHFRKPFDPLFSAIMDRVTDSLVREFDCVAAFTQSDEISLLFAPENKLFAGRLEKIVSVTASHASAVFTRAFTDIVTFDSRVIVPDSIGDLSSYFTWRFVDGCRNALNTACYWNMRQSGESRRAVSRRLESVSQNEKLELLGQRWEDIDERFRFGRVTVWEQFEVVGYNPVLKEERKATRRELVSFTDPKKFTELRHKWFAAEKEKEDASSLAI